VTRRGASRRSSGRNHADRRFGTAYAYVDDDDGDHEASLQLLESYPGPQLDPVRFLGDLSSGNFTTAPVLPGDWMWIAELVARYHDLPLGTVDASDGGPRRTVA
jgi:hypothetical protein